MNTDNLTWVLLVLVALQLLLSLFLLLRRRSADPEELAHRQQLLAQAQQMGQRVERVESELRREIGENARGGRQEIQQTLATFQETLTRQDAEATRTQNTQLDAFAQQLLQLRGTLGDTLTQQLQAISLGMAQQAQEATRTQNAQIDGFAQQLVQLRGSLGDTLTQQLQAISLGMAQQAAETTRTQNVQIDGFAQQLVQLRGSLGDTLTQQLQAISLGMAQQAQEATRTQNAQIDGFAQQLVQLRGSLGDTLTQQLQAISLGMAQQAQEATRTQNAQIDAFAQQLVQLRGTLGDTLTHQLKDLSEANARRLAEVRATLEQQLAQLQQSNTAKLDEMRATVDEKLQSTLQARLGESFKQVADRLEQVHKGLGEMQTLAQGVGDLKHLLTNVKTRGMFGEAQLAALLEQVFAPDQYATQVATRPGSRNVVDFAIRLPGRGEDGAPCWLPIDAKFPNEDYERLLDAQQRADAEGAEGAARGLEQRIRLEAKSMAEKYLEPPHTTDFAILFLPTEGLYAEVLRRPGLMEALQREHRVTLAGPTTLMAMLNSLQMGFRTLALEKRSSEVWQVLGAVKTEFTKFGDVLAKVKNQTQTVLNTLDAAETRSRAMGRALKTVEALPQDQASALLPAQPLDGDD